jgi:hypothetical protein
MVIQSKKENNLALSQEVDIETGSKSIDQTRMDTDGPLNNANAKDMVHSFAANDYDVDTL